MVERARVCAGFSLLLALFSQAPSHAQNGTLTLADSVALSGDGPGDNMVFVARRNAWYVVSLGFSRGEAVTHRMDRDGRLTLVGRTPAGPEPRAIAMARDGDYAVVVNSSANALASMSVGDDGLLTSVHTVPSGGLNPFDVAVAFDDIVVVANRDSDQINTFHIDRHGRFTPLSQAATGLDPHVVVCSPGGLAPSHGEGLVAVANQGARSVSLFEVSRRGELQSLGPQLPMSIAGSNPPASMVPRALSWMGHNLYVALAAPPGSEDVIREFRVSRRGVWQRADTPGGVFLTDIEANEDGIFAVTVNLNNPADRTDDADEVRVYRRGANGLRLDAAIQTPGLPPSFKQVSTARGGDGTRRVITTEFQREMLRSLIYLPLVNRR
jgi:6-phosphogluconolactonase (cycloisomerase 2 family)